MEDILILFQSLDFVQGSNQVQKSMLVFFIAKLPFTIVPNIDASKHNFLDPPLVISNACLMIFSKESLLEIPRALGIVQ